MCLAFFVISAFVQTLRMLNSKSEYLNSKQYRNSNFQNTKQTQWAQALIDGYVQGFPETTLLKPAPPGSPNRGVKLA